MLYNSVRLAPSIVAPITSQQVYVPQRGGHAYAGPPARAWQGRRVVDGVVSE
jgi:hypothetical protein